MSARSALPLCLQRIEDRRSQLNELNELEEKKTVH
jgi:hypothetical protein